MNELKTTALLGQAKAGDRAAFEGLFARLRQQLLERVRQLYGFLTSAHYDEDDAVTEDFICLWEQTLQAEPAQSVRDVANGRQLRGLLLQMVHRRLLSHCRAEATQKRGSGQVSNESDGIDLATTSGTEPAPDWNV